MASQAFRDEERRLKAAWDALDVTEKAVYDGMAAEHNQATDHLRLRRNIDDIDAAEIPKHAAKRLKLETFVDAVEDVRAHPSWTAGLQLMGPSTGLREEAVSLAMNNAAVEKECDTVFGYDAREVPNPPGPKQPRRTCHFSTHGCCIKDRHIHAASVATYNTYATVAAWKIARNSFPLVIRYEIGKSKEYFLLCDTVGRGDTVLLQRLELSPDRRALEISCVGGMPACLTGQQALCKLLGPRGALKLSCFKREPIRGAGKLAFNANAAISHSAVIVTTAKLGLETQMPPKPGPAIALPFGLAGVHPEQQGHVFNESLLGDSNQIEASEHVGDRGYAAAEGADATINLDLDPDELSGEEAAQALAAAAKALAADGAASAAAASWRVGIMGFDLAATGKSTCIACAAAGLSGAQSLIAQGSWRFHFRLRSNSVERYVHAACVLSGAVLNCAGIGRVHLTESAIFLRYAASIAESSAPLLDAADVFDAAASGPSSSSGSGSGAGQAAAAR